MWSPILGQRIGDHLYPDFRGFKYIPSKISIEKRKDVWTNTKLSRRAGSRAVPYGVFKTKDEIERAYALKCTVPECCGSPLRTTECRPLRCSLCIAMPLSVCTCGAQTVNFQHSSRKSTPLAFGYGVCLSSQRIGDRLHRCHRASERPTAKEQGNHYQPCYHPNPAPFRLL